MYLLQIKVKDGVIKEFLRFQCFIIMFPNGDCIKITIRILQIRLHLLKEKKTQTNKIRIRVTGAGYSLQQQQERQKEKMKVPSATSQGFLVLGQAGVQLPRSPFCIRVTGAGCSLQQQQNDNTNDNKKK